MSNTAYRRLLLITFTVTNLIGRGYDANYSTNEIFVSKQGRALAGFVIKSLKTIGYIECLVRYVEHPKCMSVNYAEATDVSGMSQCDLNMKKANSSCLNPQADITYYELLEERENLSSIWCNKGRFVVDGCESVICNCCGIPYTGTYCEIPQPRSCKDIQTLGNNQDGEYYLHLRIPEDDRASKIYCFNMSSETPFEYVTLPAGKSNNFARHYNHKTHIKEETSFEKIRLQLPGLKVKIDDYRFATTNVDDVYKSYATASDCVSEECTSAARRGMFQVDLTGTGFRLPRSIPYRLNSWPECVKRIFDPRMNADRLRWSGKCGGSCSGCQPKSGLYLELND